MLSGLMRFTSQTRWTLAILAAASLLSVGCSGGDGGGGANGGGGGGGKRQFLTLGTAPIGGAFQPVGNAIASVLEENKGENNWKSQAKSTKGSKQNIRMLDEGKLQLGMSNSAISYHAVRGEGDEWEKPFEIRAVATLAPNVGLFITKEGSGIKSIADLKGKRVTVGPAGAGFEMFLRPLLEAHGVTYDDFTQMNVPYSPAVQQLADGNCDAAFMGGAVPTPAVTQACNTFSVAFIPFDAATRKQLTVDFPFFDPVTIPALKEDGEATYRNMKSDFDAINVGSMQLISHADVDEDTVYQITKTIWENRAAIAKQHPAAKAINENNAVRFTGTPFHPGAIRFYEEIGIWKGEDGEAPDAGAGDDGAGDKKAGEGDAATEPDAADAEKP